MTLIANLLLYQLGWAACVLGAAWQEPRLGSFAALCLVAVHFWLASDRATQLQLAICAAALGLVVDSMQRWIGVFDFPQGSLVPWLPPIWMTILWVQFSTTLRYSMRWLGGRYILAACLGLLAAPLAFFAGEKLGAIEFPAPQLLNFGILGSVWFFALPILVFTSDILAANSKTPAIYSWPTRSQPQQPPG
jgi:hypothetical protein